MPQYMLPQSFRPGVPEMLSESGAITIEPTDKEVDEELNDLARSNNMRLEQLAQQLANAGVSINTLRDQIRALTGAFAPRPRPSRPARATPARSAPAGAPHRLPSARACA